MSPVHTNQKNFVMKTVTALLIIMMSFTACNDALEVNETEGEYANQTKDEEHLIFGMEYGFCIGDCIHLFMIKDNKLYADNLTRAQHGEGDLTFQDKPLDQKYYELVKDLPKKLTREFVQSADGRFGTPDAHDQGGVYIGIKQDEIEKLWFADPVTERIPEYMRDLVKEVHDVTHQILQEQQNG